MRRILLILACFGTPLVLAQTPDVSVAADSGYNGWNWNSVVARNGIITLAIVPAIGGRVMQYDVGSNPSVFVNPSEIGKTYTPANNGQWHNFGGFKTWPAPQSRWNTSGWPPPPILDGGRYSYSIDSISRASGSVAVAVSSPAEQWLTPKLRFERTARIFAGSSRIRMDETMINDSSEAVSWSMWGITQSIVSHPGLADYQNFWVYFPINPKSTFGPAGASPRGSDTSSGWKGEIAPGVFGLQFTPSNALLYADPAKGWIAYADLRDSVVFAKTFDVYDGLAYPDGGARVSVYVSGAIAPVYMEVEVKSPVVQIGANGGAYTFEENWWGAKVHGPVLDVDSVGAIGERLGYSPDSQLLTGRYGVFYEGMAKVAFLDDRGATLVEGSAHPITPLTEFHLQETLAIPTGARKTEVRVYDVAGSLAGILDTAAVDNLLSSAPAVHEPAGRDFNLSPNYPNPFNGGTVVTFFCPRSEPGTLKIYDLLGREVAVLESGELAAGEHRITWNPAHVATGVYLAALQIPGLRMVERLLYLR